ncbi:MAG: glyoxalase [Limisphaerales bacterium]
MIIALDHIQLAMPPGGEKKARKFFVGLLSMVEEEKPEPLASRGGCWFRVGTVILHVGVEKEFQPQKKAHPAFCVQEIDRLAKLFQEQGIEMLWDDALPLRRRFYAPDPFGNRIEFIQNGDGFSQK